MKHLKYTETLPAALEQLSRGKALLTVGGEAPNTMTIAWGSIGYCWNKPVFTAYVRMQRHTHDILLKNRAFTVSVALDDANAEIFRFAGSTSGRDGNKFDGHGITAVPGQKIDCPVIGECQLHFECVLGDSAPMLGQTMATDIRTRQYPDADYHTICMGEIVACYRTDL